VDGRRRAIAQVAVVHGQDQVVFGKVRRLDLLGALRDRS
jgi:hypothetical protein